jgi:predicted transcriptional regulator
MSYALPANHIHGMFISDRILARLAERPMTILAIRAALPGYKLAHVSYAISRLNDKGLIEPSGWGTYRLAAPSPKTHDKPQTLNDFR